MNATSTRAHTAEGPAGRPRARRLIGALAVVVWGVVLALVTTVGVPRMTTWFGAAEPSDRHAPLVSVALGDDPTYEWSGQGRGIVHLTYTATLTGGDSGPTTVSAGTQAGNGAFRATGSSGVDLASGVPVTRSVAIPVTCTTRTKVGLRAQTPGLPEAEVFTWVLPATGPKGDPTCKLI